MKRRPAPGGVTWSCPRCDGRTATFGLLRKAFEAQTLQGIVQRAAAPDAAAGVRCPSCLKGMAEVTLRTPDGYQELDVCRPCNFVWFDPGEYHALASSVRGPSPGESLRDAAEAPLRDPRAIEAVARMKLAQHQEAKQAARRTPDAGWKWLPGLLGMPVEFDDHEPASVPVYTFVLVGLVSLVSVWVILSGSMEGAFDRYGFKPSDPWRLGGLTALTAFFLHAGWMHLIGNMYFLWVFGDNSEDVMGPRRYLLLILLATLTGSLLHALMTDTPEIPAVGASGGISGVIAYYALRFPRMRIGVLFFFIWWLRIPSRIALALWVAMQLYGAFVVEGNIAYMAHLGGALIGVAFFALDSVRGESPPPPTRGGPSSRYPGRGDRYKGAKGRYASGEAHASRYGKRS